MSLWARKFWVALHSLPHHPHAIAGLSGPVTAKLFPTKTRKKYGENLNCLYPRRYDARLTDEELRRIIEDTDRDSSGDVDWDEYVRVLQHSCWF